MINLIAKYILFALIATILNLFTQYIFLKMYYGVGSLYLAMFLGTLIGLVIKYILDKNYIFKYRINNKKEELKKILLYSFLGIFTTLIFWSFEIAFDKIFEYDLAKYVGGLLGLALGYYLKFTLDKNIVFK